MSKKSAFPSTPSTFLVQQTAGKARIFVGEISSHVREISPVTTVNTGEGFDTKQLISALNDAAWLGNRKDWEAIATALPSPVVLACNQALASMPSPESLAIGSDGMPMVILRNTFAFTPGANDLISTVTGTYRASFQSFIDNYVDKYGAPCCRVRVMSDETEVTRNELGSVWPYGESSAPYERRLFGTKELRTVLNDPRWVTHQARAYWVWIIDESSEDVESGSYESTAHWVVEYFDQKIPCDLEPDDLEDWEQFAAKAWSPWPITTRTRFVLWQSLVGLQMMLDLGVSDWAEDDSRHGNDDFVHLFPAFVASQPRVWWESLRESCARLVNSMRTGEQWNPRTPAEEALIYLACQSGWIEMARDSINETATLLKQFNALPEGTEAETTSSKDDMSGPDYEWGEILAALTGDTDIELLWDNEMAGIEDQRNPANQHLGMGDYQAESWHQPFHRHTQDPRSGSALY